MKRIIMYLVMFCIVVLVGVPAFAQQKGLVDTVVKGCEKELKTYCKKVTPGEGRVLACLYAFSDKLSGRCEYALYDVAVQLEKAVAALSYLANECGDDLRANCSGIKAGGGRLLECLDKNDKKVSSRCKQALKDVGIKK
jgi:hypothetical protein